MMKSALPGTFGHCCEVCLFAPAASTVCMAGCALPSTVFGLSTGWFTSSCCIDLNSAALSFSRGHSHTLHWGAPTLLHIFPSLELFATGPETNVHACLQAIALMYRSSLPVQHR